MSGTCYRSPASPQIIVEAILDGATPSTLTLDTLMHDLAVGLGRATERYSTVASVRLGDIQRVS